MKKIKAKVIAIVVCGVIVGATIISILSNFDAEKEINNIKKEDKETVEIVDNTENKDNKKETLEFNGEEGKSNESEVENNISNENDDDYQKEGDSSNYNSALSGIVEENMNIGNSSNTNTNISAGNSSIGNTGNINGGNQSNVQNPSNDANKEPEIEDNPSVETPTPEPESSLTYYDGSYTGSATGRETGLEVRVDIYLDQIARVTVISHNETIGICDKAIELIPYRITASQSTDVDIVSGATFTSNGIINAANDSLSKARR